MREIKYKPPGPVAREFMLDNSFVRGLQGPIGSGKSGACIMELFRRIMMQEPDPTDKRRKSRTAIVRNTNPQLRTTTIKSWSDWLKPEDFGEPKEMPPPITHMITIGDLEAEVLFLALDQPADIRKLLSLELTFGWINEGREVNKPIVDAMTSRLRRYPAIKDGGATWSGLIMDTNAPPIDHWWPIMSGDAPPPDGMPLEEVRMLVKPDNWRFFSQPSAMIEEKDQAGNVVGYTVNELAENIVNLDAQYYVDLIKGKTKSWIDVYVMNRLGSVADGRPVHPQFNRGFHVAKQPLQAIPNVPIFAGADFGLTPAAVLAQRIRGRWLILREIVLENAGATKLAAAINRTMSIEFPDHKLHTLWGDPAGDQRVGTDEDTPFQVLRTAGINARPCETNDPELRRAALDTVLTRTDEGAPAFVVDDSCKALITGLETEFCYRRIRTAHGESFADAPDKNRYSHISEACEYLMLGAGEARELIGRKQRSEHNQVRNVRPKQDPFRRIRQGALRR